jgi:2-polyprenyl-3-methyl-5-hydroxy-6-metoxy-1,4-benzoquinol methylase
MLRRDPKTDAVFDLSSDEPIDYSDSKIAFVADRCRGKRVLDLGCVMHDPGAVHSRYFMHRAIDEVAARAVGLDLHEEGVAAMRALGYDVRVGDAEKFGFDEQFDVIVAGDIVEHLGNLDGFLKSVDAALVPGGMLIVQSPNPWYWRYVAKSVWAEEVPSNPEHTCWFCPRTWRQLVDRYGFTLGAIQFNARYTRDRWMPLPRGVKYPSWSLETVRKS